MKKVRFGIVGLGNQGTFYVNYFNAGDIVNGELTAICDINPFKIEVIRAGLKVENEVAEFTDYKAMFDSGLIDAVLVETPHYVHPEIAIEAFKRGIHVIVDKPAGVYTKQVKEMNAAAEKSNSRFALMFNQRTNCVYRKMREIITSGGIGKLQRVTWIITNWFRTQHYYDSGSWRATWAGEGGGVLMNQCPHQLDLISWVANEQPCAVRGFCQFGKWHDIEVEDEVTAYLEYASGATGVFITTTGEAPGTNRLEISGTLGKIICDNNKLTWHKNAVDTIEHSNTTDGGFNKPECEVIEVETDGENPQHKGIINNFANAILGIEEQIVDGREGINGVELNNAIELSGWNNGERITIPVDEDRFLKELNEKRAISRLKKVDDNVVFTTLGTFGSEAKSKEDKK